MWLVYFIHEVIKGGDEGIHFVITSLSQTPETNEVLKEQEEAEVSKECC